MLGRRFPFQEPFGNVVDPRLRPHPQWSDLMLTEPVRGELCAVDPVGSAKPGLELSQVEGVADVPPPELFQLDATPPAGGCAYIDQIARAHSRPVREPWCRRRLRWARRRPGRPGASVAGAMPRLSRTGRSPCIGSSFLSSKAAPSTQHPSRRPSQGSSTHSSPSVMTGVRAVGSTPRYVWEAGTDG